MKTMMRCLVMVFSIVTVSHAQWVKTSLDSIDVRALVVSGNKLFAGTESGVYLTTNNGTNWTKANAGLPANKSVRSFAFNTINIFAATDTGVYASTNDGTSWNSASIGLTNLNVSALAVYGSNIFAGTAGGIFVSINNGTNWTKTTLDTVSVWAFAINGNTLYSETNKGLYYSSNNGITWNYPGIYHGPYEGRVNSLIAVPNKAFGINLFSASNWGYMSGNGGAISRSADNGLTWEEVYNRPALSLAYSDSIIFAGLFYDGTINAKDSSVVNKRFTAGHIIYSKDNGNTWTGFEMENTSVPALIIKEKNIFAATYHFPGIWRRPLSEMISTTDSLLVPVAGGTFTAGTTPVTISSFKMDKFEVTYELWTSVRTWALTHGYTDLAAGKNGYNPAGANNPVDSVNWYDVVKWCNARSEKDGLTPVYYTRSAQDTVYRNGQIDINIDAVKWNANGYRLPTEAEWEFAAKGGAQAHVPPFIYSGSNTIDSVAWHSGNSGNSTHQVGIKTANELGIYDMSGNVLEWCWDWDDNSYPSGGTTDPKGSSTTQNVRSTRGGSFYQYDYDMDAYKACDIIARFCDRPNLPGYPVNGFRCVQGSMVGTAVKGETKLSQTFGLEQNYPNPFNPSTTITFSIPERSTVRLSIFNTLGQKISEIVDEVKDAGSYEHSFNASQLSSGIYFYRIEAVSVSNSKTFVETKKMILMR